MSAEEPIMAGLAGRYAAALFDLAKDDQGLEVVASDLNNIQALLDESEDLQRLVRSPVFSAQEQWAALGAVLERAGIGGLTHKFVGLVASNRRLFALPDMIQAFRTLLAQHRGEVRAEVTTAHALNDAQVEALKTILKGATGRDVQLDTRVDAGLLGGLVVKLGSRMVDSSLRTKLDNIKIAMKEAG